MTERDLIVALHKRDEILAGLIDVLQRLLVYDEKVVAKELFKQVRLRFLRDVVQAKELPP